MESKPGYLYAENEDEVKQLDEIYEGAHQIGRVAVSYTKEVPTPVPFQESTDLGRAGPVPSFKVSAGSCKRLFWLPAAVYGKYMLITGVETSNGVHTAKSASQAMSGLKPLIYATHMPPNINLFNFECAPYRSYAMAVKLKAASIRTR
jgi:hypothetical protein